MRTLLVLALVVAVVPLAVAGGKGEAAGAAQPIKIGAPLPLTGAYAADGEHMLMGLELAVDDLNAQGGLLGRPVELVKYDIEDLLAETVTASAEYLIKKENVDVVIEGYGGWGPDFIAFGGKYDVPFFHGSGSVNAAKMVADNPADYWNMFQVFSVEANYGIRAYEGLSFFDKEYKYPNKKIAIIHGDLEWDLLYTDAVAEFAKNDGWEVVVNETVPYGTTDWGPILLKIRDTSGYLLLDPFGLGHCFVCGSVHGESHPVAAGHLLHGSVYRSSGGGWGEAQGSDGLCHQLSSPWRRERGLEGTLQDQVWHGGAAYHPAVDLRHCHGLGTGREGGRRHPQIQGDIRLHSEKPIHGPAGDVQLQQPRADCSARTRVPHRLRSVQGRRRARVFRSGSVCSSALDQACLGEEVAP
jgi:hypothetical protein